MKCAKHTRLYYVTEKLNPISDTDISHWPDGAPDVQTPWGYTDEWE